MSQINNSKFLDNKVYLKRYSEMTFSPTKLAIFLPALDIYAINLFSMCLIMTANIYQRIAKNWLVITKCQTRGLFFPTGCHYGCASVSQILPPTSSQLLSESFNIKT